MATQDEGSDLSNGASDRLSKRDVAFTIETTSAVLNLLLELTDSGLYGESAEATAEELIRDRLRAMIEDQVIFEGGFKVRKRT